MCGVATIRPLAKTHKKERGFSRRIDTLLRLGVFFSSQCSGGQYLSLLIVSGTPWQATSLPQLPRDGAWPAAGFQSLFTKFASPPKSEKLRCLQITPFERKKRRGQNCFCQFLSYLQIVKHSLKKVVFWGQKGDRFSNE